MVDAGCATPSWITLLSALLTPTIAIAAVFIAWWQAKINQWKLRLDLFDRRYRVFDSTMLLIATRLQEGAVEPKHQVRFLEETAPKAMLFEKPIVDLIEQAWAGVLRLDGLERSMPDEPNARQENIDKRLEQTDSLRKMLTVDLPAAFAPYLDFRKP